jgi:hypothetical protein
MQPQELTAILAAILLGTRPAQSIEHAATCAEEIQRTISSHRRAADRERRETAIRRGDGDPGPTMDY